MKHKVLAKIFNQPDFNCNKANDCKREKFLSRVFGIFSEDIVDIWGQNKKSSYENLGRPSLYTKDEKYLGTTLDFTFKDRKTNEIYIVEMKCEIQYQNFKYFYLRNEDELKKPPEGKGFLEHHRKKTAFGRFEKLGKNPENYPEEFIVKYFDKEEKRKHKVEKIAGIILIWGKVDQEKIENKKIGYFHKILSVERMISDLIDWKDENFTCMIAEYQRWSNDMFDQLVVKSSKKDECRKQKESCQNIKDRIKGRK